MLVLCEFSQAACFASILPPLAQPPAFSSVFRERGICSVYCDGKRSDASGEWLAWRELCPTRVLVSSCYPARSLGWIVRALSSSLRYDANRDNQRKLTANVGAIETLMGRRLLRLYRYTPRHSRKMMRDGFVYDFYPGCFVVTPPRRRRRRSPPSTSIACKSPLAPRASDIPTSNYQRYAPIASKE